MLGLAKALSQNPVKLKRSVLFLGIGSKEQAFKGAHAYLKNPVFPKTKTVAFLNLNMVGCGDRLEALAALNYPELWEYIAEANKNTVNCPLESLPFSNIHRPNLDAAIFISKRMPSIIFRATGAPTFPYTTKDTPDTLTPQTMSDLAKILYRAILEIANTKYNFFDAK